jgi:hypothetical protein
MSHRLNPVASIAVATLACLMWTTPVAAQQQFSVVQHSGVVAPNSQGNVFVQCPDGSSAYSGGVDSDFSTEIDITSSAPTFGGSANVLTYSFSDGAHQAPTGWHIGVRNRSGSDSHRIAASVVCGPQSASMLTITTTVAVDGATPANPAFNGVQAVCPASKIATGGGLDAQYPPTMLVSSSAPTVDNKLLAALPSGPLGAPNGWSGFVRNEGISGFVKVAVVCTEMSGVVTVNSVKKSVPVGATVNDYAACPAGYVVLSGGYDPENRMMQNGVSSTPFYASTPTFPARRNDGTYADTAGWSADVANDSQVAFTMNVAAVCAPTGAGGGGPSTTTVFEFYNTNLKHYFRTANATEATAIDGGSAGPGWVRTGDNFTAYPASSVSPGADVCRFYTFGANSHFYTVEVPECLSLQNPASGWVYEGLSFRIGKPTGGACDSGTIPVHRLYNNRFAFNDSNHRFTTVFDNVAAMQALGWLYEGVAFCAVAS